MVRSDFLDLQRGAFWVRKLHRSSKGSLLDLAFFISDILCQGGALSMDVV